MSKKRKHDQVEPDAVPAQDNGPEPDQSTPAKKSKSKGQSRQEKSERRAKKKKLENAKDKRSSKGELITTLMTEEENGTAETSSKKKKNKSHDEEQNVAVAAESVPPSKTTKDKVKKSKKSKGEPSATATDSPSKPETETAPTSSSSRFIVFVGNLPYTATAAQVQDHFVKLAPSSVRLSTDKATGKGKGFAFVEFDGYDKMKTCLKLYHHSIFDPEAKGRDKTNANQDQQDGLAGYDAKKKAARRINVELTAGGGGKQSKARKERIRSKNVKLDEERERTRIKERAAQDEAAMKKRSQPQTGANTAQVDNGSIHPSRLAQMRH